MKKRGQFFLIAALVIVGVLIGLGVIYNSVSFEREDTRLYDLSNELTYESLEIVNQGVRSGTDPSEIRNNIEDLTNYYYNTLDKDTDLIVIYGNSDAIYYDCEGGTVGVGGTTIPTCTKQSVPAASTKSADNTKIIVQFCRSEDTPIDQACRESSQKYEFDIKQGQSFYIILKKTKGDQRTVITNDGDKPIEEIIGAESDS